MTMLLVMVLVMVLALVLVVGDDCVGDGGGNGSCRSSAPSRPVSS